jgi:hypothetical protein
MLYKFGIMRSLRYQVESHWKPGLSRLCSGSYGYVPANKVEENILSRKN